MQQEIRKYKIVERYLNLVQFHDIRIGSSIAHHFALNHMNKEHERPIFINTLVFIKYLLTLWNRKTINATRTDFIFTKLSNRFHFNALMNPLILHYANRSTVLCEAKQIETAKFTGNDVPKHFITFEQTNSNYHKDIFAIWKTIFVVCRLLIKNKKSLGLTNAESIYFTKNLIVQIRRLSYWDRYFSLVEPKPKCVVTEFDRNGDAAPLILAARKHKIETVTLIHGVLEDYSFTPFLAKNIFCWGEGQKKELIGKNVNSRRIFVTGNPMFDTSTNNESAVVQESDVFNFCLAISPGYNNRLLIEPFALALNQFINGNGLVKLHPSLHRDEFEWVNALSSKIKIIESSEIKNSELFRKINLLIINDSGIANEALAAGVPVAVLVPEISKMLNNFQQELVQLAGCRLASNESELLQVFDEIQADATLYRSKTIAKSKRYLKNLYETTGQESVNAMVSQIDNIAVGK